MDRPEQDFENLLRSHLSSELDAMRGQAARAFTREVTGPMERRLRRDFWNHHAARMLPRLRHWGTIGLAMAACTAMGFFLPRFAAHESPAGSPAAVATEAANQPIVTPSYADFDRTTELRHIDEGAALLPNGTPVRKLRQQRFDSLRYIDPQTKEEYEWTVPSEQDIVIPARRQ